MSDVRRRRFHGLDLGASAKAENFRLNVWPDIPDNITYRGRMWYSDLYNEVQYARLHNGILVPTGMLDNSPKYRRISGTLELIAPCRCAWSVPVWRQISGDAMALRYRRNNNTTAQAILTMPNDYIVNTPIFPFIQWTSGCDGDDDPNSMKGEYPANIVKWSMQLCATKSYGRGTMPLTNSRFEMPAKVSAVKLTSRHTEVAGGYFNNSMEPGSILTYRVMRDGKDEADTAKDVFVLNTGFQYQSNRIGETTTDTDIFESV